MRLFSTFLPRLHRGVLAAATGLGLMLAGPAAAFDPAAMTEAERNAFGAAVRAYLLENPEVLVEVIEALEVARAEAERGAEAEVIAANADALFHDPDVWVGGNPEGDVTVVEFIDYRCGFCRQAVAEVDALLEADPGVRLVRKEFPILGEASILASRFAIATLQVAGPEAYEQVHAALMAFTGDWTTEALSGLGEALGLDVEPIVERMMTAEVEQVIARSYALAQRLQINGTPSFVVGGRVERGVRPAAMLAALVEEARAEAAQ